MEKKGKKVSDKELNEMLEHVTEVLKGVSERPGMVPFGIIMRMDEDGMAGSPVCNFGDSNDYWQKLSFAIGTMLSSVGPFRNELLTVMVSSLTYAAKINPDVRGVVKDIVIPKLKETVEEESRAIKIAVPRGKGGTLS